MANSGRVDSLRSVHGVVHVIFYERIQIPRISGNFGACADSVHQTLLPTPPPPPPHEREPGFEASQTDDTFLSDYMYVYYMPRP